MRRRSSPLSQSRFATTTVLLVSCAACTTYADLPIDQQSADGTGGAGVRSSSTSADDMGGVDSTTSLGGAATSTVTPGSTSDSDSTTGSGGDTTDTTSTGGTGGVAPDSSSGGVPNSASGGTGGETTSEGGTGATGGSAGAGGGGATGGGTGGGGTGGSGTGGDTTTGATGGTGGTTSSSTFRYVRLVAVSSQNGAPYTAIAELELLDAGGQPIDPSGWAVTADSEETVDEVAPASQAIDGDTDSFWHTEWGDYEAPLPHYLQIDLGSPEEITGFVYTPRQGGIDNGHILDWEFYLSNSATDPGSAVDSGSFPAGDTVQTVNLP